VASLTTCRGCGGQHFAHESVCPRTKRPIADGAFDSQIGPYRVGKLLGAGGFGAVYTAIDTRCGARVALKLLHPELVADPDLLDRFVREAEVTVRAGNPHIVRVLEASFSGRAVFVALELLDGDTLANLLRAGPLPASSAVDIAIQTLDGLAVAHAAGVIHRDIKPANLFLADDADEPRSLVKILDFGIGRLITVDASRRLTRTGTQLGTPHFMAPEQVSDSKRADARADLYAVAVTLFAMLTGERPYGQVAVGEWLAAVARGAPARRAVSPIETLPSALVEVIAVGLEVEPGRRFQDAGAFARALLDAVPETRAATRALPALAVTSAFTLSNLAAPTVRAKRGAQALVVPAAAIRAVVAPVVAHAAPHPQERAEYVGAAAREAAQAASRASPWKVAGLVAAAGVFLLAASAAGVGVWAASRSVMWRAAAPLTGGGATPKEPRGRAVGLPTSRRAACARARIHRAHSSRATREMRGEIRTARGPRAPDRASASARRSAGDIPRSPVHASAGQGSRANHRR